METKKEQWVRFDNIFYKVLEILPQGYFMVKQNRVFRIDDERVIIKDTPQGLIQDKDIISFNQRIK